MSKRIVVLSRYRQRSGEHMAHQCWRMYQSIIVSDPREQVAFYDDGVGTSRLKPLAWLGGMFGYGLKRNLIDCYKFICRNFEPEAEIFLFGFSRGAFTVRALAHLILDQGLVPYDNNELKLHRLSVAAYRAYRKSHYTTGLAVFFRPVRDLFVHTPGPAAAKLRPSIRFIGVWDTVAAYGFPIAEITRLISRVIWPLELPGTVLDKKVRRACHALSLDDERTTFHPVLWTEKCEKQRQRISQVWFAGVHSNVGGGYPDESLASYHSYG